MRRSSSCKKSLLLYKLADSLMLVQPKYSGHRRKTRLVSTRIRSKPFEQRQSCQRRVVPRAVLQRTVTRTDEAFLGVGVTVTDSVVLSTQDMFQSFTNRKFPKRQPREDSYAADSNSGN
ncbi:hypothetical protein DPMN_135414 [Dreissena polymorpha]|uniref:Uncharacterized protein n=1 Tax=Dreissena polymorpha TaxID=45954 RepID=A0A9D4JBM9_DREPO|nr:hypothetical protein DPMN_135414 [Dreissena polymorpha]